MWEEECTMLKGDFLLLIMRLVCMNNCIKLQRIEFVDLVEVEIEFKRFFCKEEMFSQEILFVRIQQGGKFLVWIFKEVSVLKMLKYLFCIYM